MSALLAAAVLASPLIGLVAFLLPRASWRPWLLPVGGLTHLAITIAVLVLDQPTPRGGYLALDALGKLTLGSTGLLFALCAIYAKGYLAHRPERPNRVFTACLLAFAGAMNLIILSHNLGLMWVGLETATLCTAPLLSFNQRARSLEAVWKYLVVGSVGIALALLGSLLLAYAALVANLQPSLLLEDLVREAPGLSKPWLHAAFVVLFVGYGTKMGLAPMHTWKPDAYGEAPGLVGALLAGGLTSCAFLGLLRFYSVVAAAGDGAFACELLIGSGLVSMLVAGAFMSRQRDYKRLLAWSSVEHMGILVVGIGLGGNAVFGSLLHLVNNSLTKGALFLAVGNIHRAFGTKSLEGTSGAMRLVPVSAWVFLLGFFAVTGSPPFGPFVSEFTIVDAALGGPRPWIGVAFLALLVVIFFGMGSTVLSVVQGTPPAPQPPQRETLLTVAPAIVFLIIVLVLGVYLPAPLEAVLRAAQLELGG